MGAELGAVVAMTLVVVVTTRATGAAVDELDGVGDEEPLRFSFVHATNTNSPAKTQNFCMHFTFQRVANDHF